MYLISYLANDNEYVMKCVIANDGIPHIMKQLLSTNRNTRLEALSALAVLSKFD